LEVRIKKMVRSSRIKEVKWSLAISGATTGSFTNDGNIGNKEGINGEILEVNWASATGSIFVTLGDTEEEIFRRNASSGTGIQVTRPFVLPEDTLGTLHDSSGAVPFVANTPLWLQVEGYTSGTATLDVNVKYR